MGKRRWIMIFYRVTLKIILYLGSKCHGPKEVLQKQFGMRWLISDGGLKVR